MSARQGLTGHAVFAKCECGYAVKGQGTYTEAFEADFFHQDDVAHDKDWDVSNYLIEEKRPFTMKYDRKNVISNPISRSSGDPGLQLFVRGPTADNAPVSTAELMTTRRDMHYGSYRVALKYTQEPGTCGSMFWVRYSSASCNHPRNFLCQGIRARNHCPWVLTNFSIG